MKEIGGYFELELPPSNGIRFPNGILVNSGRHALEYILQTMSESINKVWIPYYTCDVIIEPIKRLNLDYEFYHINKDLELSDRIDLKEKEAIIINNYFGIKDQYLSKVKKIYGKKLIIDNAQAWYAPIPKMCNALYSPRKFFGLPDGGVAYVSTNKRINLQRGISYDRVSHLVRRIDEGASLGYNEFRVNSHMLSQEGVKEMSRLSVRLLESIDYDFVKKRRSENYRFIHSFLASSNNLNLPSQDDFECAMVYPYFSSDPNLRQRLIQNKIYVAKYWPNVKEWAGSNSIESEFSESIIPLPIDQRYDIVDMEYMLSVMKI